MVLRSFLLLIIISPLNIGAFSPLEVESFNETLQASTVAPQGEKGCYQSEVIHKITPYYCQKEMGELAVKYFYDDDKSAKSALKKTLISSGLWKRNQLKFNGLRRNVDNRTVSFKFRGGVDLIYQFPQRVGEKVKAYYQTRDGQQHQCDVYSSLEMIEKIRVTREKMEHLSKEQKRDWKKFCRESESYEKRARVAQENDWVFYEEDGDGRTERKIYQRCPAGLEWKRLATRALCSGKGDKAYPMVSPFIKELYPKLSVPKAFISFFDGYGDFNAGMAKKTVMAKNIRGDEKGDRFFGMKNANGLGLFVNSIAEKRDISDFQFLYYDGTDQKASHNSHAAANCHKDMQQWISVIRSVYPDVSKPKRIAMGYSNGGASALRFQNEISREHLFKKQEEDQLDLLLTVDPISRPLGFAFNTVTRIDLLAHRQETTSRYVNIYQNTDYGSAPPLKLKSTSRPLADENHLITPRDLGRKDGRYAHVAILWSDAVKKKVLCEFSNTVDDGHELCLMSEFNKE